MLEIKDIDNAIAEIKAKNPNMQECIRLSHLYTLRDHMLKEEGYYQDTQPMMYSSASAPMQTFQPAPISVDPSSEFLQAVDGKDPVDVFNIIDDLMDTIRVTAPRAYNHVMRRVRDLEVNEA